MDAETQKKLREKFDARVIGLKPTIWCRACRDAIKNRKFTCDQHQRKRCKPSPDGCGQNITEAHLHIEFVSHAEVTDRLLEVDPDWDWEPVAFGPDGLPALTRDGGLWIRLTIGGKTRIGYGGCDNKQGDDAIKEAISDAIKTTAMRFGVALDLWRKSEESGKNANDLAARQEHGGSQASSSQQPRSGAQNGPQTPTVPAPAAFAADMVKAARGRLGAAAEENRWDLTRVANLYKAQNGHPIGEATDAAVVDRFRESLFSLPDDQLRTAETATANGVAQ